MENGGFSRVDWDVPNNHIHDPGRYDRWLID